MDPMRMKYYVIIIAYLTCRVCVSAAGEGASVCGTAGSAVVVHVSPESLKTQFSCGAEHTDLDPPLGSGKVYSEHGCISAVKLSSQLQGAQLVRSSRVHNVYTFSVLTLPVERPLLFYYRCVSPDRKRMCKIIVEVPPNPAPGHGRDHSRTPVAHWPTCSRPGDTVVSFMSSTSRRAFFRCAPQLSGLDPPLLSGAVYTSSAASVAVPLAKIAPGVLVRLSPEDTSYVFALHRLPTLEARSYFYRCVSPHDKGDACTLRVIVPPPLPPVPAAPTIVADSSKTAVYIGTESRQDRPKQAPFAKNPGRCSLQERVIVIPLSAESLTAQFMCAAELTLLDPPVFSGSVYVDRSCSRTVPLASLWGGSLHMSPGIAPSYTVRLTEPPSNGPEAIFYRCRSPLTRQDCLVEVKIPYVLKGHREGQVANEAESVPVCDKAGGVTEVTVDVNSRVARFKCSRGFPELRPSVASGKVYSTRSCKTPISLQDHLGIGVRVSEAGGDLYAVSFSELPKEESKRFYYACGGLSGRGACKVAINVPREARRSRGGTKLQRKHLHVCHAGPDAAIRVTLREHEAVRLRCAAGLTIQPQALEDVFDSADGTCSGLSTLQSLVPGAQLLPASRNARNPVFGTELVFSVGEAPPASRQLCYHCTSNAHSEADGCKVLITVAGKEFASERGNVLSHSSRSAHASTSAQWPTLLAASFLAADLVKAINLMA